MEPNITSSDACRLAGIRIQTSLADDRTSDLWRRFMPMRNRIPNRIGAELYSLSIYGDLADFRQFTPHTRIEKWAAVAVANFDAIPEGMEPLALSGGEYAVFHYKGRAADYADTARYIFGEWLPRSGYQLDQRPHFEILTEAYRPDDPNAEEDIWIPIR